VGALGRGQLLSYVYDKCERELLSAVGAYDDADNTPLPDPDPYNTLLLLIPHLPLPTSIKSLLQKAYSQSRAICRASKLTLIRRKNYKF